MQFLRALAPCIPPSGQAWLWSNPPRRAAAPFRLWPRNPCLLWTIGGTLLAVAAAPAQGQRTNDNVLRAAQDAFGTSIGRDSIGLYSTGSVRGFSPAAAGNIRIEGLYTDAVTDLTDLAGTLIKGSAVKVGPSAHGYPFPAPTGIADFRLQIPDGGRAASALLSGDGLGSASLQLNGEVPVGGEQLAAGAGFSFSHDATTYSKPARHLALSSTFRWKPSDSIELLPFAGYYWHDNDPAQPRYIVGGDWLPPKVGRHKRLTQPWIRNDAAEGVIGLIGHWRSQDGLRLDAGLFGQERKSEISYSDQFSEVTGTHRFALHSVVATPPQASRSVSGEIRATKEISEGPRLHRLVAAFQGRLQHRRYGGSSKVALGYTEIDDPDVVSEPVFAFSGQLNDRVRQIAAGLGYHAQWRSTGEVSLNIQKSLYRKTKKDSDGGNLFVAEEPWTYSASIAAHVNAKLALFGSYVRGFEETSPAPDTAINRDEAPPAALTSQTDVGLRWTIGPDLRLIAGLFSIEKPYFSVDAARVYRRLGSVRHRGLELSLTGKPVANLRVVAGLVALDARVIGEATESNIQALRPVGTPELISLLTSEYEFEKIPGLSMDVSMSYRGRRAANIGNTLFVPGSASFGVGVRYRSKFGNVPFSVRAQASNLLDSYSWDVRASNSFFYSTPRRISISLTSDF